MEVILPYLEGKKNRKGRCLVFCGMDIVPNLSVFRHDYGVILFLSWFITVTDCSSDPSQLSQNDCPESDILQRGTRKFNFCEERKKN